MTTALQPTRPGAARPDRNVVRVLSGSFTVRHRLRAGVGVLWLIAGGLQLQPFMFGRQFADDVLGSAALSQPEPLAHLITTIQRQLALHPAGWNWPFASAELLIGAGMIAAGGGRLARLVCAGSVGFGLGIWLVGEGAGGLLTGHAALSTGAPGAALLYAVLTIAAWPRHPATPPGAGHEDGLSGRVLSVAWLAVWLVGAVLATLPAQWGRSGLGAQAAMGAMMSPPRLLSPTRAVASWLLGTPPAVAAGISIGVVALHLLIAMAVFFRGTALRSLVGAGVALSIVYWVFGQGCAGLTTGTATDVGTGPLVILLGGALLRSQSQ